MEHIIIGTAGHIDHGKTALIRALTGRETDTHKEEIKRGITIDLGFTYFDLPGGMRAGIIDVPGHEKFLPNMLAGVCGMDLVLLTVALDEGIMPQTREHLDILEQLGITNGIIVLTKLDMVDPEWADMMEEEIAEELTGRVFASWPRVKVSAIKGDGIEDLKALLVSKASAATHNRDIGGHFRIPVDRLFTVKGFGTVVAGTVLEGTIGVNQEVMLYPTGLTTKVRSLQTHGDDIEMAYAGQRAAVLLQGVAKEDVKRGMVLAYPESMTPSNRLDVVMTLSADCKRVVKNQSRVHLHIGTDEVIARVVLLDKNELTAGEEGFAQLICEREVCVKRNDKFVIRFLSPLETLGGGVVLSIDAKKHKRFDEETLAVLRQRRDGKQEELFFSTLESSPKSPLSLDKLLAQTQMEEGELKEIATTVEQEERCFVLHGRKKDFYWSFTDADAMWMTIRKFLADYHEKNPYKRGITKTGFKSGLFKSFDIAALEPYMTYLIQQELLCEDGDCIWLAQHQPRQDETYEKVQTEVVKRASEAGFALYDYAELKLAEPEELHDIVDNLVRVGQLVCIHDTTVTTPELAEQIKEKVLTYFESNEILSFASLRDLLDVSRKAAKPLMAYLDECKITQWCGKETERKQMK
ncbi:MAG: selenocysteine-specific translation elongation factor [Lachnospiraceae bacterium]|jgi:selenocysteine-specific elongation factor|nr:selenocysteine-specific translation elongation factor [Lachnospiraceae bacterium]